MTVRTGKAMEGAGNGTAMRWPLVGSAAGHVAVLAFLLLFLRGAPGPGLPGVVQVVLHESEKAVDAHADRGREGIRGGGKPVPSGRAMPAPDSPAASVAGAAPRESSPAVSEASAVRPASPLPESLRLPGRIATLESGPERPGAAPREGSPTEAASGSGILNIPSRTAPSSGKIAASATPGVSRVAVGSPAVAGVPGKTGGGEGPEVRLLRERIESRIVYPAEAIRRGQEGEVLLRIRVGEGGHPREIRIARSSGARTLDEAALYGVTQAAPLPSRPGWFEVPVRFRLR